MIQVSLEAITHTQQNFFQQVKISVLSVDRPATVRTYLSDRDAEIIQNIIHLFSLLLA